jgi:hypothetical protein
VLPPPQTETKRNAQRLASIFTRAFRRVINRNEYGGRSFERTDYEQQPKGRQTMTEEQIRFMQAIKTISPMRQMTRDPKYIVRMAGQIDPGLVALVSGIGPDGMVQLAKTIEATPAHQKIVQWAKSLGDQECGYAMDAFWENLANVMEDSLTGRITRPNTPEELATAIVHDYVKNIESGPLPTVRH